VVTSQDLGEALKAEALRRDKGQVSSPFFLKGGLESMTR
jgi:hypothetical protein